MFLRPVALFALCFAVVSCWTSAGHADGIEMTNFNPEETIRYPVAFLQGTLKDTTLRYITVTNKSSQRSTRELRGIAYKGHFKALAELVPGDNKLVLRAGTKELAVTLRYKPQTNPYYVQVIYMTDRTGNTKYQTQRRNDPQDYQAKLDTDLKLLQSFTAERMNELGFGRLTFNLEFDKNGQVVVHKFISEHPAEFFYPLDDVPLFQAIRGEAEMKFKDPHAKRAIYTAFSRYDPASKKLMGNNGRAGGGLAEVGTAGMFTWPSTLGGVFGVFADRTPINTRLVGDDSDGRVTVWGLAGTYMAVMLHELQHTWGLPHSRDTYDVIAGRGFRNINRFFSFVEPPCKNNPRVFQPPDNEVSHIAAISGSSLKNSRWFALDDKPWKDDGAPRFTPSGKGDILIEAEHGLGYLGFDTKGDAIGFMSWGFDGRPPPKRYLLTARELQEHGGGATEVRIRAVDLMGQQSEVETKNLKWK